MLFKNFFKLKKIIVKYRTQVFRLLVMIFVLRIFAMKQS